MNNRIRAFIDRINAHDIGELGELMSDNHTFIDAHGNEVTGKEKMTAGWRAYFKWFPDYYIEVTDVFEKGDTFALFGFESQMCLRRVTPSRCLVSRVARSRTGKQRAGECRLHGKRS